MLAMCFANIFLRESVFIVRSSDIYYCVYSRHAHARIDWLRRFKIIQSFKYRARACSTTGVLPNFEAHFVIAALFADTRTDNNWRKFFELSGRWNSPQNGKIPFFPFTQIFFLISPLPHKFRFAILGARDLFSARTVLQPPSKPVHRHYGARGNEVATRRFQGSRTGVRLIPPVTSGGTEGWGVEKPDRRCRGASSG